jgi:hypothetical protein
MDATLPKYMIREMGSDAKYGTIYAINPFIVILFVPIISVIYKYISIYILIFLFN